MQNFETVINDESIQKIVCLSDLHGDINSLIVSLRDCARVIRKKQGFVFDQSLLDNDMETLLNIDIANTDNGYIEDLNYEWCADVKTYVVIVGDLIDGQRSGSEKWGEFSYNPNPANSKPRAPANYKPQVEIKILRFINALNRNAFETNGSRILKLFGNHEIFNINAAYNHLSKLTANDYIFTEDKYKMNYYRNKSRIETFYPGNEGFNLLMQDGNGILRIINNNIFVHGQIVINDHNIKKPSFSFDQNEFNIPNSKLEGIIEINNILNNHEHYNDKMNGLFVLVNGVSTFLTKFRIILEICNSSKQPYESPLWNRNYGGSDQPESRNDTFCTQQFRSDLTTFLGVGLDTDINNYRLIIGHCPQFESTVFYKKNRTFTQTQQDNPDLPYEILVSPSTFGKPNPNTNMIFGITMECPKNGDNDHFIYKVDIGSSRGFDTNQMAYIVDNGACNNLAGIDLQDASNCFNSPDAKRYLEKKFLFSRTPQVLEITDTVKIFRSKMKNTRIHMPRPYYENLIRTMPIASLNKDVDQYYGGYHRKYLKYKAKYLKLKNNLD